MVTLEQRVMHLEQSCRRWQMLAMFGLTLSITLLAWAIHWPAHITNAATAVTNPADGTFARITAKQLVVQDDNGPAFSVLADKNQASMQISDAAGNNIAVLMLGKDGANLILSRQTKNGMSNASIGVDDLSGAIAVRGVDGKSKDLLP